MQWMFTENIYLAIQQQLGASDLVEMWPVVLSITRAYSSLFKQDH